MSQELAYDLGLFRHLKIELFCCDHEDVEWFSPNVMQFLG